MGRRGPQAAWPIVTPTDLTAGRSIAIGISSGTSPTRAATAIAELSLLRNARSAGIGEIELGERSFGYDAGHPSAHGFRTSLDRVDCRGDRFPEAAVLLQ
jgi:hypothetical protein